MGYFFSLSKSATTTALDASEYGLLLFGLILTLGALGEYKMLPKLFMKLPHTAFEFMVAIGIAGELFADGGVFLFSRHLQTISDGEFAGLNRDAANARREAGIARLDASNANVLANKYQAQIADSNARVKTAEAQVATAMAASDDAVAQVKTADARIAEAQRGAAQAQAQVAGATAEAAKANLELARLRTPRSLTAAQQSRIAAVLKQFPGQQFSLSVSPDPESIALLGVIRLLLTTSGWIETPSQIGDVTVDEAGAAYFSGLFIDVSPDEIEMFRVTIRTVAAALTTEGITTVPRTNTQLKGKRPKTINIGVGQKP